METVMCVKSRRTGGANVNQRGISKVKNVSKYAVACLLAMSMIAAAGSAGAALPAPNWMPGSPIMAGTQVILLWLPIPNAVKYNIYLNGKKIGESPAVQYMMASPTESGEYSILIAAVDAAGAEGAKSAPGVIRIVTVNPPASVYGRVMENKVQLKWDQAKGAVIYNVYRADKETGEAKLLSSVQSDAYTDSAVQPGKAYFYSVTAKDLAGKESAKSKPYRIEVPLPQSAAAKEAKVELKVVATKPVAESLFLGSNKVDMFGDMKPGPDGHIYVVDAGKKQVLKVDPKSLEVVSVFPSTPEEKEKLGRPITIGFTSDGRAFLVDPFVKKVFVFNASGKMVSEFQVPTPTEKEVLSNVLPHLRDQGIFPTGIFVEEKTNTIWISDPRFNTIYRFDLDGKYLGNLGHGGDPELFLSGPGEILADRNGTDLYVTEPMAHIVLVIDRNTGKIKRMIGRKASGFIGGFIGQSGITYDPEGNVVISDAGVHSIQVFDGKTGTYLYHFGDESGKVDPKMTERALLGIEMPNRAFVSGNTIYIYRADKSAVVSREIVKKK